MLVDVPLLSSFSPPLPLMTLFLQPHIAGFDMWGKVFWNFFEIKKVPWQTGTSKMRFAVRQDTFKPCILSKQISYEHLYIKYRNRIYLLSLFQNDRSLLYVRTILNCYAVLIFIKISLLCCLLKIFALQRWHSTKIAPSFRWYPVVFLWQQGHTKGTGLELVSKIQPPSPVTHKELYLTHYFDRGGKSRVVGKLSFVPKYE